MALILNASRKDRGMSEREVEGEIKYERELREGERREGRDEALGGLIVVIVTRECEPRFN